MSTATAKSEPVPEPEPQETVIKKITLANFNCELHNPNWSAKTIDYYWCKHEKFPPDKAVEVEGSLRVTFFTKSNSLKKRIFRFSEYSVHGSQKEEKRQKR